MHSTSIGNNLSRSNSYWNPGDTIRARVNQQASKVHGTVKGGNPVDDRQTNAQGQDL